MRVTEGNAGPLGAPCETAGRGRGFAPRGLVIGVGVRSWGRVALGALLIAFATMTLGGAARAAGETVVLGNVSGAVGVQTNLGISLNGFDTSASYQVTLKFVDGSNNVVTTEALQATQGSTTLVYGYSSYSGSKLGFRGDYSAVASTLASVKWTPSASGTTLKLRVGIASAPGANEYYDANTGHYYRYVSSPTTWPNAKSNANSASLFGLRGYLAHVTSSAENAFISSEMSAQSIWIGATDAVSEGDWRWSGATNTIAGETDRINSSQPGYVYTTGLYSGWASNEPNDYQPNGEDCAVTNWGGTQGAWNDLHCTNNSTSYLIEFGGNGGTFTGTSVTQDTLLYRTQAALSLTSIVGVYQQPLALTASGGTGDGALSYAVASAGSANCTISGSTLSAATSGTCTVTATRAASSDGVYAAISSAPTTVTFPAPFFDYDFGNAASFNGGTAVTDVGGGGNNGTLTASTNVTTVANSSRSFVALGGDREIWTTSQIASPGSQEFTVEAWVRGGATMKGAITNFESVQTNSTSQHYDRMLVITPTGQAAFGICGQECPAGDLVGTTDLRDGAWHHVVGRFSKSGTQAQLFVDGALQATATKTTAYVTSGWWRIGGYQVTGWFGFTRPQQFIGDLGRVRIYNAALTPTQVAARYAATKAYFAPARQAANLDAAGTTLTLTFSEPLSSTTASTSAYAVQVAGATRTVNAVAVSGSTVTLTLASAVRIGQIVTVGYSDPTTADDTTALQASTGIDVATFSAFPVTNGSTVKQDQTVSFTSSVPTTAMTGDTYQLAGAATSALAVTFTSTNTGVCTVSGTTVTMVAAGACVIKASQDGDATFNAAPQVQQEFTVYAGCSAAPTNANGYDTYAFVNTGSCIWTVPSGYGSSAAVLVVGGGGGAGFGGLGGGGGGGGVRYRADAPLTAGTRVVIAVGAGGAGGYRDDDSAWTHGDSGQSSSFGSVTALGGGGGGGLTRGNGLNGGSGGGGAYASPSTGGTGTGTSTVEGWELLGQNGASGTSAAGGGGGGAGAAGSGANGGAGVTRLGLNVAGGGGGWPGGSGATAYGGGGASTDKDTIGSAGAVNTGGGGGGGASGGSGIVVVRMAKVYSITYFANGATSGTVPSAGTYTTGTAAYAIAANTGALARTGYTFAGWNTADDGNGTTYAAAATITPLANTSLYALWSEDPVTVAFDANGGSGSMSAVTRLRGVSAALPINTFTRSGYAFAGWATATGSAVVHSDGGVAAFTANSTTLYAKWVARPDIGTQPLQQTIFVGNTGTFTVAATIADDGTLSYRWQVSTDSGASWNDVSTGTGATTNAYTTAATTLTQNGYLYRVVVTNTPSSGAATVTTSSPATLSVYAMTIDSISALTTPYGTAATRQVTVADAVGAVSYAIAVTAGGSVAGVTIDATGLVTVSAGTAAGTYGFTVTATDTQGGRATRTFTVTVERKALTVSGLSAGSRAYNGGTGTVISGTPTLVGVVSSDDVAISGTPAGQFTQSAVGGALTVNVSGLSLSGAAANNYALTQPTLSADITRKQLTVNGALANNKVYDASRTATVNLAGAALVGVEGADSVAIDASGATYTFAQSDAANGIGVTVTGLALSGSAAGNYSLTQPTGLTANITARPITVVQAAANATYGDAAPTFAASVSGLLGSDTATVSSWTRTFDGSSTVPTAVGSYTVTPSAATLEFTVGLAGNYNVTGYSDATYTIARRPVTVTAADKTKVYGDADPALTYIITGGSLVNGDTLTGTLSRAAGETVGTYAISGTLSNASYTVTVTPGVFTITQAEQVEVTLTSTSGTFGTALALTATGGSSTGAYAFAIATAGTAQCSLQNGVLTAGAAGTCTVTVERLADTNFQARTDGPFTVTFAKAARTIDFPQTAYTLAFGETLTVSASASAGDGAISYDIGASTACTLSGTRVTVSDGTGTCVVTAAIAEGTNHLAASTSTPITITVQKASQTIAFPTIADRGFPRAPVTVAPTASSGLTPTITSTTTGVCTVSGFDITVLTQGTCTVVADQGGDGRYLAATSVARSFVINGLADPVVGALTLGSKVFGDGPVTVTDPSADVPGTWTYTSSDPGTVTVNGKRLTLLHAGSVLITGTFTPTDTVNFNTSTVTATLVIAKAQQAAIVVAAPTSGYVGREVSFSVSGGSGSGAWTYSVVSGPCLLNGQLLTASTPGACVIEAAKTGDADHEPQSATHAILFTRAPVFDVPTVPIVPTTPVVPTRPELVADPTLTPSMPLSVEGGASVTPAIALVPEAGALSVSTPQWQVVVKPQVAATTVERLVVRQSEVVEVSGTNYEPNALVRVFALSTPRLLGEFRTNAQGAFSALVTIPSTLPEGAHTLQIHGYAPSGVIRAIAVPLVVKPSLSAVEVLADGVYARLAFAPYATALTGAQVTTIAYAADRTKALAKRVDVRLALVVDTRTFVAKRTQIAQARLAATKRSLVRAFAVRGVAAKVRVTTYFSSRPTAAQRGLISIAITW